MALLTVQNLSLGYDAHIIAKGLNFSVQAGDYLCIVGENGSGKTTLIKHYCISGSPQKVRFCTVTASRRTKLATCRSKPLYKKISRHP